MALTRWLGETSKHMTFKRGSSNAFHNAKRDKKHHCGSDHNICLSMQATRFKFFFLKQRKYRNNVMGFEIFFSFSTFHHVPYSFRTWL